MTDVPSNLIPTTISALPEYAGFNTIGYFPYVLDGRTYKVQFSQLAGVGAVPSTRRVDSGTGLTGGGDLSVNRTIAIANGGVGTQQLENVGVSPGMYGSATETGVFTIDAKGRVTLATTVAIAPAGYVPTSTTVTAGVGLSGGGMLTGDIQIDADLSDDFPLQLGVPSAGSSLAISRADHIHPAVNLSDDTQTEGVLPLGRGGTGNGLSPLAGSVVFTNGTQFDTTGQGTPGQVLISNGSSPPYWETVGGIGTVTSVNADGGTTGMTFTGGPITGAGTLTLGGTLAVANGGTGATTASGARTSLDVPQTNGTGATGTWSISIGGNAATVTNGVYTNGSYADPAWITSLDGSKVTGDISGDAANVTGVVAIVNGGTGATDAPGARTALGLGTLATLNSVNNSNWSGTALSITNGGTGATTAAGARIAILPSLTGNATKVLAVNSGATDVEWVAGGGTVTSIDVSGGTTGLSFSGGPVTVSGTITMAGTLGATNGGTGQSAYTTGDILYASGSTTLAKLADVGTGNALISGGVGVAPGYGKIGLTTHITGTLAVGNGGTGATTLTGVVIGNGTGPFTAVATLPVGRGGTGATTLTGVVIGNGTSAFTTVTAPSGTIVGTSDTQTLTNKTINLSSNTVTGTKAQFNTACSDGDFVFTDGGTLTDTLTLATSTTSITPLVVPHGTAPTSPPDGGYWTTTVGAFARISGVSRQFAMINGAQTFTTKTISLSNNTLSGTLAEFNTACTDADFASLAGTETLTNKRINPRANVTTTTTSPWAWNSDSYDGQGFTALANNLTISADAGTPVQFQKEVLRFKASGADRTITFTGGSSKAFNDCTDGALTVSGSNWTYVCPSGKTVYVGCIYNTDDARWDIVAVTKAP